MTLDVSTRKFARAVLGLLLVFCLVSWASAAEVKPSNKWRIECSGGAHSTGTIELRVTPHQGAATVVSVAIAKGRAENAVAGDIRDALRAQLPPDRFHIEKDDGEDVLIKKKAGQPDFLVELAGSSVEHVRLSLHRE